MFSFFVYYQFDYYTCVHKRILCILSCKLEIHVLRNLTISFVLFIYVVFFYFFRVILLLESRVQTNNTYAVNYSSEWAFDWSEIERFPVRGMRTVLSVCAGIRVRCF